MREGEVAMKTLLKPSLREELRQLEGDTTALLREVVSLAEEHNLSSVVFNSWADVVGRISGWGAVRPLRTAISLFTASCLIALSFSLVVSQPILPTLHHVLFFLGIGCFAVWIVWRAYHYLVPKVVHYAIRLPCSDEERMCMLDWFSSVFSLRKQVFRGMLTIAIGELIWVQMDQGIPAFPTSLAGYVSLGFACMFVSQGAHWLLAAPTYLTQLSKVQLDLKTFDPAESRSVRELTQLVIWFVLACGLTFALGLTLYLFVWPYSRSPLMLLTVYVIVLGLIVYSFVRSNIDLARIIRTEKSRLMCDIQEQIVRIYESHDPKSKDELDKIKGLWELYEKVKSTKNSALGVGMFRSLSGSLLLQVVPIIAKISLDMLGGKPVLDAVRGVVH